MKAIGRILIIILAFAITMGVTYKVVNASGLSQADRPRFDRGGQPRVPQDGFPQNGDRREFRGDGPGGFGWIFGFAKNIILISIITTLITVPKNRKQRRMVSTKAKEIS